jgi:hypothetical protein
MKYLRQDSHDSVVSWFTSELTADRRNKDDDDKLWKKYYDMLHCKRPIKKNDWESDIFLPEFTTRALTLNANFLSRYFQSSDIVESDSESDDPQDVGEGKAAKLLLNHILGKKDARYFQKVQRMLLFSQMSGWNVWKLGYEQETEDVEVGQKPKVENVVVNGSVMAEDGKPFVNTLSQKQAFQTSYEPIVKTRVKRDTPVFDVWPNESVYTSKEYTYSLQEKEHVTFVDETTVDDLKENQSSHNYFNLDKLDPKQAVNNERPDNVGDYVETENPVSIKVRRFERWGKFPAIVTERYQDGSPKEAKIGVDKNGRMKSGAEKIEMIMTFVGDIGNKENQPQTMIRFQPSPYPVRPMVRFICYVDPLRDEGFGDGEQTSEISTAINDNFNLSNYRTKLATTPAFKGKKFSGIPEKINITPEKAILMENLDDFQELAISDNIQGAMVQHNILSQRMDFAMATSPQTMGMSPDNRETATQAATIGQRAQTRLNMKAMNFEYIGFTELYDVILSLVNEFMLPQTLEKILGELAQYYNPKREDRFKPVSQAIESEESKQFKIKQYTQMMGMVASIPNPKTAMVLNYIIGQILELSGGDFKHFKKFMFEESPEAILLYQIATGAKPQQPAQPQQSGGPQNQFGLPQTGAEQNARAQ